MAAGSKTSQKRRQTISNAYRVHAYVAYSHIFMMYVNLYMKFGYTMRYVGY